jgi:hypothetical protein
VLAAYRGGGVVNVGGGSGEGVEAVSERGALAGQVRNKLVQRPGRMCEAGAGAGKVGHVRERRAQRRHDRAEGRLSARHPSLPSRKKNRRRPKPQQNHAITIRAVCSLRLVARLLHSPAMPVPVSRPQGVFPKSALVSASGRERACTDLNCTTSKVACDSTTVRRRVLVARRPKLAIAPLARTRRLDDCSLSAARTLQSIAIVQLFSRLALLSTVGPLDLVWC